MSTFPDHCPLVEISVYSTVYVGKFTGLQIECVKMYDSVCFIFWFWSGLLLGHSKTIISS